jgi:hypothetical protein
VLEAQAGDGVCQLDVHRQVVGVELELVAGAMRVLVSTFITRVATSPSNVNRQWW